MATMSSSSKTLGALTMTLALATAAVATSQPSPGASTTTTNLTLHNLCPYPVWLLMMANAGVPSIPTDADDEPAGRLDGNGEGLATLAFPPGAWSGRVVVRMGCDEDTDDGDDSPLLPVRCATGDTLPMTVAQVSVGGPGGAAAYSVSLVDGFNVAVVVTPHGRRPVPPRWDAPWTSLPSAPRAPGGGCGTGATEAVLSKHLCHDTRTNATDVEVTPQDCVDLGEIKVVFCPKPDSVVAGHL